MATLKLARKTTAAPDSRKSRPPVRGTAAPRKRPTLAQAQAERAARAQEERPARREPQEGEGRAAGSRGRSERADRPASQRPERSAGSRSGGSRAAGERQAGERAAGDRPAKERFTNERSDKRSMDKRSTGGRSADGRFTGERSTVERSTGGRSAGDGFTGGRSQAHGGRSGAGRSAPGNSGPSRPKPDRPPSKHAGPPAAKRARPAPPDSDERPRRPKPAPAVPSSSAAAPARPRPPRPAAAGAPRAAPPAPHRFDEEGERLSKRMTALGLASRREADEWIEAGWVRVNGRVAVLGQRVGPDVRIDIDPAARGQQAQRVTILLHKPVGYVSGQAEDGYENAAVLVRPENQWSGDRSGMRFNRGHLRSLAPAGRLDIDSVGLLVLTQDGRIAKLLIGDESRVEKEYLVRVQNTAPGRLSDANLALLQHGLELDGQPLRPAKVSWQNEDQLRFVLREGKKRQIRRMCEAVGLKVLGLKRVRIGSVALGQLPQGQWRYLRSDETFI